LTGKVRVISNFLLLHLVSVKNGFSVMRKLGSEYPIVLVLLILQGEIVKQEKKITHKIYIVHPIRLRLGVKVP